MKILLDECVTKHLKPHLINHQVSTVRELGWSGVKNGKLMSLCVENEFDILLTIDKNLQHQQNLHKYPITIVIFNSTSSKIEELLEFLPVFEAQLLTYQKHTAYQISR
jgi:predicted nuclease of predicted toxin-antitoxin system